MVFGWRVAHGGCFQRPFVSSRAGRFTLLQVCPLSAMAAVDCESLLFDDLRTLMAIVLTRLLTLCIHLAKQAFELRNDHDELTSHRKSRHSSL